jgi:hypothetical protein
MGKANPENCPHPFKAWSTPKFGHLACGRCGTDITDPARSFEIKHSERVTLTQGDRVAVRGDGPARPAFQGVFHWSETFESGVAYMIGEFQTYKHDGKTYQGIAGWYLVRPERVRQAPGVRERNKREEAAA